MPSHISAGAPWPVRFAFFASAIFLSASGATNLIYGWQRGIDLPSSLVWAGVSVGVSILFALSWPALLKSVDARRWARAAMISLGLVLSGGYSISAALGSASGGRANAAALESAAVSDRARAQADYDATKGELAKLQPSRPLAEMQALVDAARPRCRVIVENGRRETQCVKPADLTAELGRAKRRAELELRIENASIKLESARPARQANSDSVALAGYLSAVGVHADAETVNRWLVILAVLAIEMGGGLSLAVAMALQASAEPQAPLKTMPVVELNHASVDQSASREPHATLEPAETPTVAGHAVVHSLPVGPRRRPVRRRQKNQSKNRDRDQVSRAILNQLRDQRVMDSSERQLAQMVGATRPTVRRALHGLAAAGAVRVQAGSRGSVVTLLAA